MNEANSCALSPQIIVLHYALKPNFTILERLLFIFHKYENNTAYKTILKKYYIDTEMYFYSQKP